MSDIGVNQAQRRRTARCNSYDYSILRTKSECAEVCPIGGTVLLNNRIAMPG
jgi:hypothetical protein